MTEPHPQAESSCRACGDCRAEAPSDGPSGWRLALSAAGLFLAPTGLAVLGAAVGGPAPAGRVACAAGGFLAGIAAAVIVGWLLGPRSRKEA
ncbi:MAG TPA: hypothetical protein VNA25_13435 [Phycisphaerae bacterium]|nr:hypothetical protein [Phycisphaerae bacterium]HUT58843.1 hypothetical protein [Phycisphaerae bacterium]